MVSYLQSNPSSLLVITTCCSNNIKVPNASWSATDCRHKLSGQWKLSGPQRPANPGIKSTPSMQAGRIWKESHARYWSGSSALGCGFDDASKNAGNQCEDRTIRNITTSVSIGSGAGTVPRTTTHRHRQPYLTDFIGSMERFFELREGWVNSTDTRDLFRWTSKDPDPPRGKTRMQQENYPLRPGNRQRKNVQGKPAE